jgi:hypothetical protein
MKAGQLKMPPTVIRQYENLKAYLRELDRKLLTVIGKVGFAPLDGDIVTLAFQTISFRCEADPTAVVRSRASSAGDEAFAQTAVCHSPAGRQLAHACEISSLKGGSYHLGDRRPACCQSSATAKTTSASQSN